MLNQVVLVGKLQTILNNILVIKVITSDKEEIIVKITIKNNNVLNNIKEYVKSNDTIGIKGHIDNDNIIIADKITFLSSGKGSEE